MSIINTIVGSAASAQYREVPSYAYTGTEGASTLYITDLSNNSVVGSITNTTRLEGIIECKYDAERELVYTTARTDNLLCVIDVSDPSNPTILDFVGTGTNTRGLAYDKYSKRVYVAAYGSHSLISIDVSNPSDISVTGSYTSSTYLTNAYGVALDNTKKIVYVTESDGITSFDVSGTTPAFKDSLTNTAYFGFQVTDPILDKETDTLYLISGNDDTVSAIDVSDPTNMSIKDTLRDTTRFDNIRTGALDADNKILYVGGFYGLSAIDVSDPTNMVRLNTETGIPFTYVTGTIVLDIGSGFLYNTGSGGLDKFDISDPYNITHVADVGPGSQPLALNISQGEDTLAFRKYPS